MNTYILLNRWGHINKIIPKINLKNIIYIENYSSNSILDRSKKIENKWNQIEDKEYNLIGLSLAGIDLKVALTSSNNLLKKINNIGFIGTPHNGSKISEMSASWDYYKIEKVIRLQGISFKAFKEYNQNNILNLDKYFNNLYEEKYNNLFNLNGSKLLNELPENYRLVINEANKNLNNINIADKWSDGLFYENETIHNNIENLANLNLDQNNILLYNKYNNSYQFLDLLIKHFESKNKKIINM